ncbi:eclosion hormone-like [Rhopalosiphum maidis]|uniref:eclosion hormone-like n=1 Tax=Rhopalosiphum maidis TaxID=43146 RepID=UPI000EFDC6CE|nr:eclosion hormone-like [Rhopalosiphum maidis]
MMNTSFKKIVFLAAALALIAIFGHVAADMADVGMCIRNCAQCKKMLGAYFEGPLCADACVKFKGKMIPDCENIESVAPFLNKLE